VKRSFTIGGHRTSISLESAFWGALRDISKKEQRSLSQMVHEIDQGREAAGLSSAVRVWILNYYRKRN
jgi:predicted DNA-binding ribbon-helix-helix protein